MKSNQEREKKKPTLYYKAKLRAGELELICFANIKNYLIKLMLIIIN